MRYKLLWLWIMAFVLFSCKKQGGPIDPQTPPMDSIATPLLLKEILIPLVPSPYYYFEYNAVGKPIFVSFASGFNRYDIIYDGGRISEMRNNIVVNKDRLQYTYDNKGRVSFIQYLDSAGVFYAESFFTYDLKKLVRIERFHKQAVGTVIDREMTMQYGVDDNLASLTIYQPPINGLPASTTIDMFEQYDNKVNVDGFGLLHPDFFEHFFLLPGVQLQKNNQGKLTRSGDGTHYKIDYSYTYNNKNIPLVKNGKFQYLTGTSAGQVFHETTNYSFY
ncbi:MAG: hypothetical protein ABIU77_16505 [Ferruginibacter sp.]